MPVDYDIKGKVIVLTGAASGIGFQTSLLLARQGAYLSIADINEAALKEKTTEIEKVSTGKVLATLVDVRDDKSVNAWIAKTVETFGKLDGAVNLAGVIPKVINKERVEELNNEDWHFVLDVNLHGVMHCMRAQLQNMNNKGSLVNAASICGVIGFPKNAAYTASKHAVIGLSRTAAKEVGDREIRVNCIAPGLIDGPMQQKSVEARGGEQVWKQQILRRGTPQEVGALIAWLLCDDTQYITGTVQIIDGGWVC
ncbi:NAD(P)-binding protein [Lindgomyces ingoldianus]|uniref:NAD(P)-binding protein n=1 Tax=Lindgomyces ingoldianus TaxID=673940 RepID=A0ACB6QRK4_9PLEO|nr:NAD(P)-binding protein [Lindgomyces ingoldianus]KAF2468927.1 NAD(P)-binding protein [Lindgomyces ingoldianus]